MTQICCVVSSCGAIIARLLPAGSACHFLSMKNIKSPQSAQAAKKGANDTQQHNNKTFKTAVLYFETVNKIQ